MNRRGLEDGTVLHLRDIRKDVVEWIHLRDKKRVLVNILINLLGSMKGLEFLKKKSD